MYPIPWNKIDLLISISKILFVDISGEIFLQSSEYLPGEQTQNSVSFRRIRS